MATLADRNAAATDHGIANDALGAEQGCKRPGQRCQPNALDASDARNVSNDARHDADEHRPDGRNAYDAHAAASDGRTSG